MDGHTGCRQVDLHLRNLAGRLDTQNLAVRLSVVHGLDSHRGQPVGYVNRSTHTKPRRAAFAKQLLDIFVLALIDRPTPVRTALIGLGDALRLPLPALLVVLPGNGGDLLLRKVIDAADQVSDAVANLVDGIELFPGDLHDLVIEFVRVNEVGNLVPGRSCHFEDLFPRCRGLCPAL